MTFQFAWKDIPPDADSRDCSDCKFCVGYVSAWCINKAACEERGTQLPNAINCEYWEPIMRYRWWHWFDKYVIMVNEREEGS